MPSNEHGQPIGESLGNWSPPSIYLRTELQGPGCELLPLDVQAHGDDLYRAVAHDTSGRNWTYLGYGPFGSQADYRAWLSSVEGGADPMFFTIIDRASGAAVGIASYLGIDPAVGSIEVGHIHFSPLLQRTTVATEAMYLMMKHVFDLGYRRYEWKCDSLNAPSCAAARRFGFSYEGLFRQATLYKGRNRDTAWFSILDKEWPALQQAYSRWLAPGNFDDKGQQLESLSSLTAASLSADRPT